jgi:hypothetical protein
MWKVRLRPLSAPYHDPNLVQSGHIPQHAPARENAAMVQQDIIYFDIAAVVVIAICLLSFLMRRLTRRPETRVFFTAMVLVVPLR